MKLPAVPAEISILILGVYPALAAAAPPGEFSEKANSALFSMPNRVTPDPMDLNYPMLCVDTNDNGREEIISGGGIDAIWRVMEFDPGSDSFSVAAGARLPYPPAESGANQGKVALIDTASTPGSAKLYASIINGSTQTAATGLYDLKTRTLERVTFLGGVPVGMADLDNDGTAELVTFQDTSMAGLGIINVYDLEMSRALATHRIEVGVAQGIALGNLDDDTQWELASTEGLVYELTIDGIEPDGSFATRMDDNWIDYIEAADVDGDGRDEVVAAYWTRVAVIDHDVGEVKWSALPSVNPDAQLKNMRIADVLGDPLPEIVVGQEGHPAAAGHLIVFEGWTGAELQAIQYPDFGVYGLNGCDVDGDGIPELIAGMHRTVTGPDRLYVFDAASGLLEWRSNDERPPVLAAAMADLDADGRDEIMFAPNGIVGVGDVKVSAYDALTLEPRWVTPSPLLADPGTGPLNTMAVGDANADGSVDLVVGSSHDGFGQLWGIDGRTHEVVTSIRMGADSEVRSAAFTDVTGDGVEEIVAAMSNGLIDVRNPATGESLWTARWGLNAARDLEAADVDQDGRSDLVVLADGPELIVIDGATRAVRMVEATCPASIAVLDVPGSGQVEIVAGGCDGSLQVFDGLTGAALQNQDVCTGAIDALAPDRLSTGGPRELLFACEKRVGWASLETAESRMITAVVGDQVGSGSHLFSGGTSAASDYIAVTTLQGVTLLRPTASLAPYVIPLNTRTTNIFATHWRTPLNDSIAFGSFDGSAATLEVVKQPAHGSLSVTSASQGQFTYAAQPFTGTDILIVRARTAENASPPTGIPILVRNSAPEVDSEVLSLEATAGSESQLPLGISDFDDDPLTYELVEAPSKGTVELAFRSALYTPRADASGTDEFSVRAFDQVSHSPVVTVQVSIAPPPPPPSPPPPSGPPPQQTGGGGGGPADPFMLLLLLGCMTALRRHATKVQTRGP